MPLDITFREEKFIPTEKFSDTFWLFITLIGMHTTGEGPEAPSAQERSSLLSQDAPSPPPSTVHSRGKAELLASTLHSIFLWHSLMKSKCFFFVVKVLYIVNFPSSLHKSKLSV